VDDFGSASRLTKSARPLLDFGWTYDGRHLLFSDDTSGEENHRIWAITHDTADAYMLTPENGDAARRRAISPDRPDTIVAGLNDRDAAWHDAWDNRSRLRAAGPGIRKPGRYRFRVFDYALSLRLLGRQNAEQGGSSLYRYDAGLITPAFDVPYEDDLGTYVLGFERDDSR